MLIAQNFLRSRQPQPRPMAGPMRTEARAHAARLGLPKPAQNNENNKTYIHECIDISINLLIYKTKTIDILINLLIY